MQATGAHPWLGYGYAAFWNDDTRWVQYIWQTVDWRAPTAHNGYIEVVLEIGLVGLALYAWIWGRIIILAVASSRRARLPVASWVLLFLVVMALLNLDEGTLPYPDQFALLMPGVLCSLEVWRSNDRKQLRLDDRRAIARNTSLRSGIDQTQGIAGSL